MNATVGRSAPRRAVWMALAALAIGLATGYLLAGTATDAAPPGAFLLDARLPVTSEGAVFAFTVAAPCDVRVRAQLQQCCAETQGEAALSRLLPAERPHRVYEPEAEEELRFRVHAEATLTAPWSLEHPGVYAICIPAIPTAMGTSPPVAWVRVERVR